MNQQIVRRIMRIANLALAGIIIWQTTALANPCPPGNQNCNVPRGCSVIFNSSFWACSTVGSNCCQYQCDKWTYIGQNCPQTPCVTQILVGILTNSTCNTPTNGLCMGFLAPKP